MPTIKDVAKHAGVSIAAVSRALNDYPDISPDTKEKILKVVKELRYYPKASARHLVTQQTHTIGVFFPALDGTGLRHPFISHLLNVFKNEIGKMGYDLMLLCSTAPPHDKWTLLDRVRHRDIDGVLLIGMPDDPIDELLQADLPLVGIDVVVPGKKVGSVTSDNRRAIHSLMESMYQAGYRKFGFIHGPLELFVSIERLQGFYGGLHAIGLSPNPEWIADGRFLLEGGREAAKQILASKEWPEVIICSADISAIGAMQVFQERGIAVPDQISLVGFDDIEASAFVHPPLTTVSQQKEEMGRMAAQIMSVLIESEGAIQPMHYVVSTKVVIRESTRPFDPV